MKSFAASDRKASTPARKTDAYVHKPLSAAQRASQSQLQDILGNVQSKLVIGRPNDSYEREADQVADQVVSLSRNGRSAMEGAAGPAGTAAPLAERITPLVQRQAAEEEEEPIQRQAEEEEEEPLQAKLLQRQAEEEEEEAIQPKLLQRQAEEEEEEPIQAKLLQRQAEEEEEEPIQAKLLQRQAEEEEEEAIQPKLLQRQAEEEEEEPVQAKLLQRQAEGEQEEEEEPVQMKASPGQQRSLDLATRAVENRGSGRPMQAETRSTLEAGLGQDLSDVRVHEDALARDSARSIGARAYTYKNHIWLGRGESQSDLHLMAHETTHVLQQGGVVRRKPSPISHVAPRIQGGWLGDAWGAVKSAGSAVVRAGRSAISAVGDAVGRAGAWVLEKVAGFANDIPGFTLLTVILGKNPITNQKVERNAVNLIRGFMGLIPGGNALFENLEKAGVIERAYKWFSKQIQLLNLTWTVIKGLFTRAWDSLSATDLLSPSRAFAKIKAIFLPPLVRIKNFAVAAGKMVMQFIFEGALSLAGGAGQAVLNVIRKGKETFLLIIKDPIGFLGNLLKAVGKGFSQFGANIWKHLKAGLFGWLFGALSSAGIELPEKFDLKGIVSLVLQVLGLTYANLRARLVKLIGEKPVSYLEKAFEFVKVLVTEGIAGAWQKILEYMGSLRDIVVGAIKEWVVTKIVTAAVTKLASMFNPVGAIIQAIIAIYNTVMFFIERAKQIMALANAVFDSVINIARGKLKAAADYVEITMARTIPVIISFLARLLGLGGIAGKIMAVIRKIQQKVDMAIDKVVGFIVKKAKSLLGKGVKTGKEAEKEKGKLDDLNAPPVAEPRTAAEKTEHVKAAGKAALKLAEGSSVKSSADLETHFPKIKKRYRLTTIGYRTTGDGKLVLSIAINPKDEFKIHERMEGTGLDGIKTDVKWETGSLGGDKVGKRMRADWLGPDHPQGTPPGSGVQSGLMGKLITDPSEDGDSKYIRGHLLNDNLGGEGKDFNLYPITGNANKKHHDTIESKVKGWVNSEKYWVSYAVDVDEQAKDLSHGKNSPKNYVNAVFKCKAAIKGTDGKEYDTVTSNISSTYKKPAGADVAETTSADKPEVSAAAQAMDPRLSTSKSDKSYVFHSALYDAMGSHSDADMKTAVESVHGLGSGAWSGLKSFYSKAGGNKSRNLASALSSSEKAVFTMVMGKAAAILANLP